jgi:hypothetical protein
MWNTYGWWLLATVAFFVGIALIVAGLAFGALAFLAGRRSEAVARSQPRAEARA